MINQVKAVELIDEPTYQEIVSDNIYNILYLIVHEYRTSLKQGNEDNYRLLADEAYSQILSHALSLTSEP